MKTKNVPATYHFSKSVSSLMGIDMATLSPFLEPDSNCTKVVRVIGEQLNATRQLYYKSERVNAYFRDFEKPDLSKITLLYAYSFNHESFSKDHLSFKIEFYGTTMAGSFSFPPSVYDFQYDNDFPLKLTINHFHFNERQSYSEYHDDDAMEILSSMQSVDASKNQFFCIKELKKLIERSENIAK